MLCSKFGWIWPSGSGEEDENVKSLQTDRWIDRRMERQIDEDARWSEKLTWSFGSGELNRNSLFRIILNFYYTFTYTLFIFLFFFVHVLYQNLWNVSIRNCVAKNPQTFSFLIFILNENIRLVIPAKIIDVFEIKLQPCSQIKIK